MSESNSVPENPTPPAAGSDGQLAAVLPLRDIVVFPHMIVPLFVGREKSVRALEEVMSEEKQILLLTQKNAGEDDPSADGLYRLGTLATVLQLLKLPDQTVRVLVEGKTRARVKGFSPRTDFFQALIEPISEQAGSPQELEALVRSVKSNFEGYIKLNKKVPAETLASVAQIEDPAKLADTVASHLTVKIADRQQLLETLNVVERLERVLALIEGEIGVLQVERKIRSRVKRQMEKTQREYYLNEQLKAIQKELGEGEEGRDELAELEERIKKTKLSKEAREKAQAEVKKLRSMSPMSAEATVVRNYLDWMLSLPWGKKSKIKKDIGLAENVLNEDHYGLEKVKERILEYLAVQSRSGKMKGPILCLVGPPGVGKTSLGKSIARATGREFVRMSLGGVRDEAEIRGHRRTYIGALPGRLVRALRDAGTMNPVILLDEVDKVGADWRGDPSAALLEVLDPAQNHSFRDHYLDVELDLSEVFFIATANVADTIPGPLLDRMEVIRFDGYTVDEKTAIARGYLWPRQIERNGLREDEVSISDDTLQLVVSEYTREAGVRQLERELGTVLRKTATQIAAGQVEAPVEVDLDLVRDALGRQKFFQEAAERTAVPGVATGLAVTGTGGDVLFVEATRMDGANGELVLTGQLGDVMKESARIALSYIRSHAEELGIEPDAFKDRSFHVHVPAGAIPKDGPSAGITMTTALASLLSERPVKHTVGMTGEVTLQGRVLPIGGLKQKVLAAHAAGLTDVIIPERNRADLDDVPEDVREAMRFHPVMTLGEVLELALEPKAKPSLHAV